MTNQNHIMPLDLIEDLQKIYGGEFSHEVYKEKMEEEEIELERQRSKKLVGDTPLLSRRASNESGKSSKL